MKTNSKVSYIVFVGAVLVLACSSELRRTDAQREIEDRLAVAADLVLEEVAPTTSVQIGEILQPSDARRIVRFQLVNGPQESDVFEASYMRSDDGWSMTGFDPGAVDLAESIGLANLAAGSAHLVSALEHLYVAVRAWRMDQPRPELDLSGETAETANDAINDHTERMMDWIWNLPTRSVLKAYSERQDLDLSERADLSAINWGVSPEHGIMWAQDAQDDSHSCVWPQRGHSEMKEFPWIVGGEPQCRAGGVWFKAPLGNSESKAVVRRGKIWLP